MWPSVAGCLWMAAVQTNQRDEAGTPTCIHTHTATNHHAACALTSDHRDFSEV